MIGYLLIGLKQAEVRERENQGPFCGVNLGDSHPQKQEARKRSWFWRQGGHDSSFGCAKFEILRKHLGVQQTVENPGSKDSGASDRIIFSLPG